MSAVEARDAVWGHLDEIDWSRYVEVPDELTGRAQTAFYARFHRAAPVDCAEDMVMAITGDPEPDMLLALAAMDAIARILGVGRKLPRDPDPRDWEAFAYAVAIVRGIRDKQTELEESDGA